MRTIFVFSSVLLFSAIIDKATELLPDGSISI